MASDEEILIMLDEVLHELPPICPPEKIGRVLVSQTSSLTIVPGYAERMAIELTEDNDSI